MDIQQLQREFRYNGVVLADPNQTFTLPQVRDFYATVYSEIVSADIEGPEQLGAKVVYTFRRAVGTKGTVTEGNLKIRNYAFTTGSANFLSPKVGDQRFVVMDAVPAPAEVTLKQLTQDLAGPLEANWMLAGDAQFIKDVGETLREVGAIAISAAERERLAALHREYCQLQAA